jgi:hypothetical protein
MRPLERLTGFMRSVVGGGHPPLERVGFVLDGRGQVVVEPWTRSDQSDRTWEAPPFLREELWNMLAPAVEALRGAASGSETTYRVVFSEEVQCGLRDGTLHLARSIDGGLRAIAQDSTGSFVAHGSLISVSTFDAAGVVDSAWSALAFVVRLKYLRDINQHLSEVKRGIDQLQGWNERDRLGKLRGNLDLLLEWQETLATQPPTPDLVRRFEAILDTVDQECLQLTRALASDMQELHGRVSTASTRRKLQIEREVDPILVSFESCARAYLVAVMVRLAIVQVTRSLPVSQARLPVQVRQADEAVDAFRAEAEQFFGDLVVLLPDTERRARLHAAIDRVSTVAEFAAGMAARAVTASARFAAKRALQQAQERRSRVADRWENTIEGILQHAKALECAVQAANSLESDLAMKLPALYVTTDGCQITRVSVSEAM